MLDIPDACEDGDCVVGGDLGMLLTHMHKSDDTGN